MGKGIDWRRAKPRKSTQSIADEQSSLATDEAGRLIDNRYRRRGPPAKRLSKAEMRAEIDAAMKRTGGK